MARHCIGLFKEETGRFPASLEEANEYGRRFPDQTDWRFPFREAVSDRWETEDAFRAQADLDGRGGFF